MLKKQDVHVRPKFNGNDSVSTVYCGERIGHHGVAQARLVEEERNKGHWSLQCPGVWRLGSGLDV